MLKFLFFVLSALPIIAFAQPKADRVIVSKTESKLYLMSDHEVFRAFKVAFGNNPVGHKQHEGDERTPEGEYVLDYKNDGSSFYKSIHISYPNENDINLAKKKGVDPGGLIMIHGQRNGFGWLSSITQYFNWTDGCIAITNSEMDEIWEAVDIGTPIEIMP
ncbi:MAG: L,D-transpeptidase family protein [Candidatus Thiodiazotropha sp. (ex Dulcina madagascariensis)]|nr:L,D-transpeptidase family protein [Candidatus Thiodiazotropha sp. (ex Dulcina madagascariensis)]